MNNKIISYYNGKTILIIGATSGIGQSIALELSRLHTNLALAGRDIDKLNRLSNELSNTNIYKIDITNYNKVNTIFNTIESDFGSIYNY